jgi:UDP-2,4-diacetamido-2,4,6-trideoxy-beta-L-altropyranose hydrolase
LLVRADADTVRGTGHIMRCLALAQAWQARGGCATFISNCEVAALRARIEACGAAFMPLQQNDSVEMDIQITRKQLAEREAALLVLDGYHFDAEQQQALRIPGHPLLVIDDFAHLPAYHTDVLLNQNLASNQLCYSCDPDTRLLLGPTFALLRPEFADWRRGCRDIESNGGKILVTLGGSDPDNCTLRIIAALDRLDSANYEAKVVVGSANRHGARLEKMVGAAQGQIELLHGVTDMAPLMAWANVAVAAGGTTCWELACMGLPALVVILADNQRRIAEQLHGAGIVENLGWHESVSTDHLTSALQDLLAASLRRKSMSEKGRRLVDGRGAQRVVQALIDHAMLRAH